MSEKHGYELKLLAVDHPGQEQKATRLQVRRYEPDWVFLWGWGVMNQVALKEAAGIDFPMDRMIGVWWSGSELDVIPAGDQAIGYKAATFHEPGADFPLFQAILEHVYGGDVAKAKANHWSEVLFNRSVLTSVHGVEAMRTAMRKFGNKPLNGEQLRWGYEHLDVDENVISDRRYHP